MTSQAENKAKHSAADDEDSSKKASDKGAADAKGDSADSQELNSLLSTPCLNWTHKSFRIKLGIFGNQTN